MKNKKTMIISGIASIMAAVIIYLSGGQVFIATLLGGAGICTIPGIIKSTEKNKSTHIERGNYLENNKPQKSNEEQIYIVTNTKTENNDRVVIAPIKQYNELIMPKLITIDALSQKESTLVRIRKKETEENLKQHNDLKYNKK